MPPVLADDRLRTVRSQVEIFGLHAAALDIREESGRLAAAMSGILRALGIDADFARRADGDRTTRLVRLLSQAPPKLADLTAAGLDEQSAETWRLFRLLARVRAVYGAESLGPFTLDDAGRGEC